MYFIFFSCLIAVCRTCKTMLNRSGESGHPCLVLILNTRPFWPLSMMLAVVFSNMAYIVLMYDHFIPTSLNVFIINGCWTLSNVFSSSIYMIVSFLSFILFMWCSTHIDLWILYHPCIPGMINPTWSWCVIFLMYCWIWITSILLRILTSMFIRDIGL